MANVDFNIDSVIAHLSEVNVVVHEEAMSIASRAQANLAAHHKTGEHSITVDKQDTDYVVSLVGRNVLSVEYGHIAYKGNKRLRPEPVPGLRIIRNAAGL